MSTASPSSASVYPNKPQFYPGAPLFPFQVQTTPALPPHHTNTYGYSPGCNGSAALAHLPPIAFPAVPHTTSNGYYAPEINTHSTKYDDLSPVNNWTLKQILYLASSYIY